MCNIFGTYIIARICKFPKKSLYYIIWKYEAQSRDRRFLQGSLEPVISYWDQNNSPFSCYHRTWIFLMFGFWVFRVRVLLLRPIKLRWRWWWRRLCGSCNFAYSGSFFLFLSFFFANGATFNPFFAIFLIDEARSGERKKEDLSIVSSEPMI